jgi:hypothetical protein
MQLPTNGRPATLDLLLETTIPLFLRFKANPVARRGGGPVYYSVAAAEKFFRSRVIPDGRSVI